MVASAADVLTYWFGDAATDAAVAAAQSSLWWGHAAATDAEINRRFGSTLAACSRDGLRAWGQTARDGLARILVADQFPRNIYRGSGQAFATDALARDLARALLAAGAFRDLRRIERVFACLPFEHSEGLADQALSVRLFTELRDEATADYELFDGYLDFAVRHHEIIARFGRFPHRNEALGRPSTAAELTFLEQPGSSF